MNGTLYSDMFDVLFFLNSILIGAALAMDAFSVSVACAISDHEMRRSDGIKMALTFAVFQIVMPLIGWFFVSALSRNFAVFERWLPVITFLILGALGISMIKKAFSSESEDASGFIDIGPAKLAGLGIATSIDALSVGFTIAGYSLPAAVTEALIIGAVTFAICFIGILIGKKIGTHLADKAEAVGGAVLLAIGLEILIRGMLH